MKVGTMLPSVHSVALNAQVLEGLGQVGVDSVWMADHLLGISHPDLWPDLPASAVVPDPDGWLDPFCLGAALGGSTDKPFGTCVTDSVRRRGADLARAALTMNQICSGGFILGIGSGEAESTLPFGYSFDRPVGRLEEALKDIRSMLDHGTMSGDGPGRTGLPRENPPAVWVAAGRPRGLRLTGTYGDGWLPPTCTPEEYADQYAQVKAAADQAGRPMPTAGLFPLVIFGRSGADVAATLTENPLSKLILLFAPAALWRRYGLEHPSGRDCRGFPDTVPHLLDPEALRAIAGNIPIEMVEEFLMLGNAQEITSRLQPFHDAGLEHVVICDLTGFTYAPEDAAAHAAEFAQATRLLQSL